MQRRLHTLSTRLKTLHITSYLRILIDGIASICVSYLCTYPDTLLNYSDVLLSWYHDYCLNPVSLSNSVYYLSRYGVSISRHAIYSACLDMSSTYCLDNLFGYLYCFVYAIQTDGVWTTRLAVCRLCLVVPSVCLDGLSTNLYHFEIYLGP